MSATHTVDATGAVTARKTYVTFSARDDAVAVFRCGEREVEVPWCELFEMLSCAVSAWNRRAE